MDKMIHQPNRRKRFIALSLIFLFVALPFSGAAAGPKGKHLKQRDDEGQQLALPMDRVTIAEKTLETVKTNIGRQYALSEETIVTGLDGGQVTIRELLVPCDAEITYVTEKGVRQATRIKVIRTGNENTWKWKARLPE